MYVFNFYTGTFNYILLTWSFSCLHVYIFIIFNLEHCVAIPLYVNISTEMHHIIVIINRNNITPNEEYDTHYRWNYEVTVTSSDTWRHGSRLLKHSHGDGARGLAGVSGPHACDGAPHGRLTHHHLLLVLCHLVEESESTDTHMSRCHFINSYYGSSV